jgi:hypothetical protein
LLGNNECFGEIVAPKPCGARQYMTGCDQRLLARGPRRSETGHYTPLEYPFPAALLTNLGRQLIWPYAFGSELAAHMHCSA